MTQKSVGYSHNLPIGSDARVYVPIDERNALEIHDLIQRFAGPVDCQVQTIRTAPTAGTLPQQGFSSEST